MTAERVLPLEGGRNFRDMGGYETTDGRRTRWRRLFRSGALHGLTDADYAYLADIGVKALCDFRSTSERERDPTSHGRFPNANYYFQDYVQSLGDLHLVLNNEMSTAEQARATMFGIYRGLPEEQAPSYRELFRALAEGEVPLVFNCSAGKDRTGLAAALVLTVLNVPEETILDDYALSNRTFDFRAMAKASPFKISAAVHEALGGTHPDYLKAALGRIDETHGSIEAYLREALGVTEDMLAEIRAHLLE